jgi:hypothetical protein
MGLSPFSKSSADESVSIFSHWKDESDIKTVVIEKSLPNPKPDNYKILRRKTIGEYLMVEIQYLDCTNYEGRKILVFKCKLQDLLKQKLIDPHFSENKNFISPIARFEPTEQGGAFALFFVRAILKNKTK